MKKLNNEEIEKELADLSGWQVDGGKLFREFVFDTFPRAFGFMASVALLSEAMNHHPEWFNVYTTVRIWLNSHEVAGISDNDILLARKISSLAGAA